MTKDFLRTLLAASNARFIEKSSRDVMAKKNFLSTLIIKIIIHSQMSDVQNGERCLEKGNATKSVSNRAAANAAVIIGFILCHACCKDNDTVVSLNKSKDIT